MAATVTFDAQPGGRTVAGDRQVRRGSIDLGAYATGGVAVTKATFDLPVSLSDLRVDPASGYTVRWDKTNGKLMVYTATGKLTGTFDAGSLNAVTARDESVTFTGLVATDEIVGVRGPDALEAKYMIKGARATGTDTAALRADNHSAASIDPASGTYTIYRQAANNADVELANAVSLAGIAFRFRAEGH